MEKTNLHLNISINTEKLEEAENILEELGLDLATAVQIFIHKITSKKGMPFDIRLEASSFDQMHAFLELLYILNEILTSDLDALLSEENEEDEKEKIIE